MLFVNYQGGPTQAPTLERLLDILLHHEKANLKPPDRLTITKEEFNELRKEVPRISSMGQPDKLVKGFAGYLYGVPLFVVEPDPLIVAAQKIVDAEQEKKLEVSAEEAVPEA